MEPIAAALLIGLGVIVVLSAVIVTFNENRKLTRKNKWLEEMNHKVNNELEFYVSKSSFQATKKLETIKDFIYWHPIDDMPYESRRLLSLMFKTGIDTTSIAEDLIKEIVLNDPPSDSLEVSEILREVMEAYKIKLYPTENNSNTTATTSTTTNTTNTASRGNYQLNYPVVITGYWDDQDKEEKVIKEENTNERA